MSTNETPSTHDDQSTEQNMEQNVDITTEETDTPDDINVDQTGEQDDAASKPHREAARYRKQLREAEAERDALAERYGRIVRKEVEAIGAELLSAPGLLFLEGRTANDYIDGDGLVDAKKVQAAADALISHLGSGVDVRPNDRVAHDRGNPPVTFESDVDRGFWRGLTR